jgi:phosphate transport system substrate-binding protein
MGENHRIGVLIVLNDVTRLRRLENIRKDFVANVSHELKTPSPASRAPWKPCRTVPMEREEDSTRFLGIIAKQADRLNAIIDDLLELSRIEQGEGSGTIVLTVEPLAPNLRSAANACQALADGKDMRLRLACEPELGVSGNLNSIGSDTLNNLMTMWAEGFRKQYPNVNIQIEGKGSSTAPPALIEGTAQIGPMSREMKKSEIEAFEKKYGYKPTKIGVALDSLAVYVNKDNPIEKLSLQGSRCHVLPQSQGRLRQDIVTWGQAGLVGTWAANRRSASTAATRLQAPTESSRMNALFKGDFKDIVKEQPGSASVVLAVTEDLGGIGYSGIGYKTSGVKAIALSKDQGEKAYEPSYENVLEGNYPLGRMLYLYVAKKPNEPLPKMVEEFLKYAVSKEGQEVVVKDGYLPLPARTPVSTGGGRTGGPLSGGGRRRDGGGGRARRIPGVALRGRCRRSGAIFHPERPTDGRGTAAGSAGRRRPYPDRRQRRRVDFQRALGQRQHDPRPGPLSVQF